MIDSAARAERFEAQSPAPPFYLWEVPQKPVCVRLPFPLIDRLEKEAVESFRSLSSRGSEIGGLLLGKVFAGSPTTVLLEEYELITCDYSRGPLYRLSEADSDRFGRAIAQHSSGGLVVVGFFRSHTRKGVALDPEDVAFLDARFPAPHHIALLIRPFATKASAGGIFIRENGAVRGEASYKEFAFRSSELTPSTAPRPVEQPPQEAPISNLGSALPAPSVPKTMGRGQIVPIASRREVPPPPPPPVAPPPPLSAPVEVIEEPPVEDKVAPAEPPPPAAPITVDEPPAPPVVEPPPAPEAAVEEPPVKSESRPMFETRVAETEAAAGSGKLMRILLGVAAALIVVVGLFVYPGVLVHRGTKTVATQDANGLSLRTQHNGGEILLTWNRDSDVIRNATHAVLSINDGPQHENYDMDVAQLRIGSISYTPITADVVFKMDVTVKGRTDPASESVRALQSRPSPMPQAGQPSQPEPVASTKPAPTPAEAAPADPNAQEAAPAKAPEKQMKAFRAESLVQRLHPTSPEALPDAPSMGGVGSSATTPIAGLNLGSSAPPPAARTSNPTPSSPAPSPAAPAPAASKPATGGNLVPAQLQSKRDPEYPKIARDAGAKGLVKLLATVGADGRVKSVQVLSGHPMLQKAAQDAVMQWRYKPTLLNGVPVEAPIEVTVNFQGR